MTGVIEMSVVVNQRLIIWLSQVRDEMEANAADATMLHQYISILFPFDAMGDSTRDAERVFSSVVSMLRARQAVHEYTEGDIFGVITLVCDSSPDRRLHFRRSWPILEFPIEVAGTERC